VCQCKHSRWERRKGEGKTNTAGICKNKKGKKDFVDILDLVKHNPSPQCIYFKNSQSPCITPTSCCIHTIFGWFILSQGEERRGEVEGRKIGPRPSVNRELQAFSLSMSVYITTTTTISTATTVYSAVVA
jgi:hypothetical protein